MDDLETLIEKLVTQLGYELVDFETVNGGQILRIYIDKRDLIDIEDCTKVSNHVNNVLSVETDYDYERLEVSSPGLDRVIKKLNDFDRFKGQKIKIQSVARSSKIAPFSSRQAEPSRALERSLFLPT